LLVAEQVVPTTQVVEAVLEDFITIPDNKSNLEAFQLV
jgi:hypothetical protein